MGGKWRKSYEWTFPNYIHIYPPTVISTFLRTHCTYIYWQCLNKQHVITRSHVLYKKIRKRKRNVCVLLFYFFPKKKFMRMARGTKNNNQVPVSCWVSPSSPSTRLCPLHFLPKIKKGQDKHKICFLKIKK